MFWNFETETKRQKRVEKSFLQLAGKAKVHGFINSVLKRGARLYLRV